MSLRDKAREVKAAGVAERGNFAPSGVPKRAYQWWLSESNSKRARRVRAGTQRENFCHFWRVVLFWAPARKIVYGVGEILPFIAAAVAIAGVVGLIYLLITNPLAVLGVLALGIAIVWTVFGIFGGASAGLTASQRREYDMIQNKYAMALTAVAVPTFVLSYLITRGIRFYRDNLTDYNKQVGIGSAIAVVIAATATLVLVWGWGALATWILAIAIGVVGLAFALGILYAVATYIDGKRAIAKAKREDRQAVYLAEHGHLPVHEPSAFEIRLKKILSGAADFIVLIAQVVRVKKWKICPMIEIEDEDRAAA